MGVDPNVEVTDVLGVADGVVSTPWSNPLFTYELHHSQIEQLVGLCAKRFEFEFVIQPQVGPRVAGSDLALNMGIAAHEAVSRIIKGDEAKCIDDCYDRLVVGCITDPGKEEKIHDEYQLNVFSALDWLGNNLTYKKIVSEQKFIIPDAHTLSPTLKGIDERWKLAGSMDVVQFNDNGTADIVDLKFRGRTQFARNQQSSQAAMYGLATLYYGYMPTFTYLDVVKGKVTEQHISLDQGKYDWLFIKARQALDFIETGNFPISPSGWHCSPKFCKWWQNCRGKYEPDTLSLDENL